METGKETPYYGEGNKINSGSINKYIGKTCYICFKKPLLLSFYSRCHIDELKVIVQSFDGYFLNVLISTKKQNYSSSLAINNICSISTEENS